ncbi:DUF4178 domain-containing protein [Saccharopolyspora hordei]|uniref:DUF4178 domain-containing protein n=1 Tax=Saccharopolyspora hordei TaxID=1838 RepID=A0A853ANP1_9PSEU|nr:hypothetical protein [Saccharopolyspora hordei]
MNGLIATLVVVIIVLVVLAVVAVVFGLRAKRAAARPQEQPRPTDPFHTGDQDSLRGDPRALKAGDIVEVRGRTYTVRGTLRLSEGGWTWSEHLLDDAQGTQVWLAVEEDPDLILSLWTPVDDAGEPGPKTISFGGRTYHSEESGSAEFRSEATTGLAERGTVRYHDYQSSDGALLGFESYGGAAWEASTGEALSRYDVIIYPAAS